MANEHIRQRLHWPSHRRNWTAEIREGIRCAKWHPRRNPREAGNYFFTNPNAAHGAIRSFRRFEQSYDNNHVELTFQMQND